MKKALVFLSMIISMNSFALICTSEDNPAKKLKLNKSNYEFVTGEVYIRTFISVFAGTYEYKNYLEDEYTLFDQKGKKHTLTVKKELQINHCRARVCPGDDLLGPKDAIGKLSVEGEEDEYFTCI
jgi:hypothetical protein